MTLEEILAAFPLLRKDIVYAIEKKGLIRPAKKVGHRRRHYSDVDVRNIALVNRYCANGIGLQQAIEMARATSADVRADGFALISEALIEIVGEIRKGSLQSLLKTVVRHVGALTQVECVALYTSPDLSRPQTAYHYIDRRISDNPASVSPLITNWRGRDKAENGEPYKCVNLSAPQLRQQSEHCVPSHLLSGDYFSVLVIPLKQFKSNHQGFLVLQNKLDPTGKPGIAGVFDGDDEALGRTLGDCVFTLVELVSEQQASRAVVDKINAAPPLTEFLTAVLTASKELTGADRGEITWRDNQKREAIVLVQQGPKDEDAPREGDRMPGQSINRRVLETGKSELIEDVNDPNVDGYKKCWRETVTELAVPIMVPSSFPLAVINLESRTMGRFDAQDQMRLESVARQAALYASVLDSKESIARLIRYRRPTGSLSVKEGEHPGLEYIACEIVETLELEGAIIYLADYNEGALRCAAFCGTKESGKRYFDFHYGFHETSLASKVFRERAHHFSPDPRQDPCVSARGLDLFNIAGAVLGLPLTFGMTIVGVIAVWDKDGKKLKPHHLTVLEPYGDLAVTALAVMEAEQRGALTLNEVRKLLVQIQECQAPKSLLPRILKSIVESAFERARVFERDDRQNAFVCMESFGVEPPSAYCGVRIPFNNEYAKLTLATRPNEPEAVIRDPRQLGEDSDAALVGKPLGLPWAVAPLFVGSELFGYIVGDNKMSNRAITNKSLNVLTLFAALAAQALWRSRTSSELTQNDFKPSK
jgi:GAF domain-containing protein/DNA-binding transcriptional MerR regulator